MRTVLYIIINIFVLSSGTITLYAQCNGCLDSTFGTNGVVITDVKELHRSSPGGESVAIQSDGKILIVGNIDPIGNIYFGYVMMRYNPNGEIDSSFGTNGRLIFTAGGHIGRVYVLPDDRILLFGGVAGESILWRLNPNGDMDSTFGIDGRGESIFGHINAVSLTTEGEIISAGEEHSGYTISCEVSYIPQLSKHSGIGKLNISFADSGSLKTSLTYDSDRLSFRVSSVHVQDDGKILITGRLLDCISSRSGYTVTVLARFQNNGLPDSTYGVDGIATRYFNTSYYSSALQKDGMLVVGGTQFDSDSQKSSMFVARYKENGTPDSLFGTNGYITIQPKYVEVVNSISLQADGKILLVGRRQLGYTDSSWSVVARLMPTGVIDTTFGDRGFIITNFDSLLVSGNASLIQSDNKLLVTGTAIDSSGSNRALMLMRYITNVDLSVSNDFTERKSNSSRVLNLKVFPNPLASFNKSILLSYDLVESGIVKITAFNTNGQVVGEDLMEEYRSKGIHNEKLALPSGISAGGYLIQVQSGGTNSTIKLIK